MKWDPGGEYPGFRFATSRLQSIRPTLAGQHRQYQANTVRNRVVLSTIFIGLQVIDDARITLRWVDIFAAWQSLDDIIQGHCLVDNPR